MRKLNIKNLKLKNTKLIILEKRTIIKIINLIISIFKVHNKDIQQAGPTTVNDDYSKMSFKQKFKTLSKLLVLRGDHFIKKKKRKNPQVIIDGILNINSSLNNVIITYTDLLGKPQFWSSCGRISGVKKGSRSNYFIILETLENFSIKLKNNGIKNIYIKFNGIGLIRKTLLKGLKKSRLQVHKIYNITPIPHNGCRPKKYRRV